jgi:large subunit ribosomal protein L25
MKLTVQSRTAFGKKVRELRKSGNIPAVIYGNHLEQSVHISINKLEAVKAYRAAGSSTAIEINGDGIDHLVLIQEIQLHPVSDHLIHMDLLAVNKDEKTTAEVPLILVGESPFEKDNLGRARLVKDSLEVEALPMNLPHDIKVDISEITEDGQVIFAKDLDIPADVELISDPEIAVVVSAAFREVEEVEEEVGLGEALAEGDADAAPSAK